MPSIVTTTETVPPSLNLKASPSSSASVSPSSALSTLRSLYPRAAKAFLQRNVALTHTLLTSAFSLIDPPPSLSEPDPISSQRRKWEILRITFETTLYASPPPAQDPEDLPAPLRANLMLSPELFIATIHTRALQLFTPVHPPQKPSSAFLPAQILVTLALASLKLGCANVGRGMTEDWLARHGQGEEINDPDGYAKALELYCLHVLPRLEDWDYAESFLQYERDLLPETRQYMLSSLRTLRAEAAATSHRAQTPSTPKSHPQPIADSSLPPSRSVSPTPSTSSVSSSSTHTATPRTPRPNVKGKEALHPIARLTPTPASTSTQSIASTATSRTVTPAIVERQRPSSTQRRKSRRSTRGTDVRSSSSGAESFAVSPLPRPPRAHPLEPPAPRPPTTLALIRSSFEALVQSMSRTKVTAYFLLFVVFPLLSVVFRVRRRRPGVAKAANGNGGGTVDEVRRRLNNSGLVEVNGGPGGLVRRVWEELVRAVSDTVQMGGRGLV